MRGLGSVRRVRRIVRIVIGRRSVRHVRRGMGRIRRRRIPLSATNAATTNTSKGRSAWTAQLIATGASTARAVSSARKGMSRTAMASVLSALRGTSGRKRLRLAGSVMLVVSRARMEILVISVLVV